MAVIAVTQDTPTTFVATANRALDVTVSLVGVGFSVYAQVIRAGAIVDEFKIRFGESRTFGIIKDDDVIASAVGTGNITVTTANA